MTKLPSDVNEIYLRTVDLLAEARAFLADWQKLRGSFERRLITVENNWVQTGLRLSILEDRMDRRARTTTEDQR